MVLEFFDGSELHLDEKTQITVANLTQTSTGARVSRVKLLWGRIRAFLSPQHQIEGPSFDIETPNALIGVKFSEPDVEVSYSLEKAETVGIAHTVELLARNLVTDEETIIPVGSMAIITAVGIKVMAGAAARAVSTGAAGTGTTTTTTTIPATAEGMGTGTKVAIGVGTAAAVGGVVALATGSGDETTNLEVGVICTRFPANDQYWVQTYIIDPHTLVASTTLSGSYGTTSLTYNLSPRHPGWCWTDPNIFISQEFEPDFPLYFTVPITFKDGTTRDVSKTIATWEWAE